jgi:hypothetical protein
MSEFRERKGFDDEDIIAIFKLHMQLKGTGDKILDCSRNQDSDDPRILVLILPNQNINR